MSEVAKLLEANRRYASAHTEIADANPSRHLAVVTCMDARIDVFAALGLQLGEAHVLRNAGGRVTDDVLRSLALSCHVLGVETVVVMQHTRCGLAGVTDEQLQRRTGADLGFFPIDDHAEALAEDVALLIGTPYLAPLRLVVGVVFDVETGEIHDVTRWERDGCNAATPACEDDAVMTADDVLHVVRIVHEAGVTVWLDGGWGIDALLGAQFRRHEDLDVVVPLTDVDAMTAALDVFGYVVAEDHLPTRLVLRTSTGLQVDVHPVTFDAAGIGWQVGALPDGGDCAYPAEGFVEGTVGGTAVGCLSAEVQLAHHLGYPPQPHDRDDMERLAHHLGLTLPPPYAS